MRLFLVESGLVNYGGHHYMEASSFQRAARKHGVETTVLAHKNVHQRIADELNAQSLFSFRPYESVSQDPVCGHLENFLHMGTRFTEALDAVSVKKPAANDVLVVLVSMQHELLGIARWLQHRNPESRPMLVLNFMIDNLSKKQGDRNRVLLDPLVAQLYRFAFKQLSSLLPASKLLLFTGSAPLSNMFSNLLAFPVQHFPLPVCHNIAMEPLPGFEKQRVVAYIGKTHPGKLASQLPRIVREIVTTNPEVSFLIQANPASLAEQWRSELPGLEQTGQLHIFEGDLKQEAYYRLLNSANMVFLPYRQEWYRFQTSGIFSEAISLGKITIVPDETWMSDILKSRDCGGVIMHDASVENSVNAINAAMEAYPSLSDKAFLKAPEWRDKMGMTALVEAILEFARSGKRQNVLLR